MNRLEAAFIEPGVMRHQRKPLNLRGNAGPYLRKNRRILRILRSQPMNSPAEPLVILRLGMDEGIERI